MKTICLLIMFYCTFQAESSPKFNSSSLSDKIVAFQQYSLRLIGASSGSYGYEIYSNNKIFIRQATVPGLPGNKGFRRKADAEKVAKLVIAKLSQGIMPTVKKHEMDQLHIQY